MNKRVSLYLAIATIVLLLFSGCNAFNNTTEENEKTEETYTPVEVSKVKEETLYNMASYTGIVTADKDIFVIPKIMGKVSKLNVKVGDTVEKGNLLFMIDQTEIKDQVKKAEDGLNSAKKSYQTILNQIKGGNLSLQSSLQGAQAGVSQGQMAYDKTVEMLNSTYVTSPISGTVSSVNISEGNIVTNQQPSIVVSDIGNVKMNFFVSEDSLSKLERGKEILLSIPSANIKNLKANIDTISPSPDMRTSLYPITVNIKNTNNSIKPGMSGNIDIKTDIREKVMVINSEAVNDKNGESVVYVVEGDLAKERIVTTGIDNGEFIEITSGLNKDDLVIVKGQNYVEDGSKIKVVKGE